MKEEKYVTIDTGTYIVGKGLTSIKNLVKKVKESQSPIKNIQGVTVIDGQFDPILKEEPNKMGRMRTVISVGFLHWYFVTDGIDQREKNKGQLVSHSKSHSIVNDRNSYSHIDRQPMVNVEFEEIPQKKDDSEVLAVKLEYEQRRVKELEKEVAEYKEQIKEFFKKQDEDKQKLFEITENSQRLVQNQQTIQIHPKQLEEDTTKPRKWWQRKRD
jgi:hypothetical protein